jgi:U3 small nucleolar RNA-associated protein 24
MSQKFQRPRTSHDEQLVIQMGVQKKTRKFAQVKRIIGQRDARLKKNQLKGEEKAKPKGDDVVREM